MSTAAILCDTGALLDYLVARAPDHRAFRDAIDRSRTRYVPGLVLAEVDYFLRNEREAMGALIRDVSRGAFTHAAPTPTILERAMDVDRQYADLGLGLVDASVVALAEELGVYRLATRPCPNLRPVARPACPQGLAGTPTSGCAGRRAEAVRGHGRFMEAARPTKPLGPSHRRSPANRPPPR